MPPTIAAVPGVEPFVEIGVGDAREDLGVAVWQPPEPGTSPNSRWAPAGATKAGNSWVGLEPSWIDVSCYVQEISTFIGRERAVDLWEVGTATITVANVGGWADAPPVSNPLHPLLTIRPGRQIRAGVIVDGTAKTVLWRGYIDATYPGYDAEIGETVTFDCIDAKGEVGRAFVGEVTTAVGAGDFAHARVGRILNAVNWPNDPLYRDLSPSGVALQATTFGAQSVDLLDIAADSSGGGVFGDVNGKICYRQRDWQVFDPTTPIQGTIGNFGGADDACPISWEQSWAREDISTRVLLSRPDDTSPVMRESVEDRATYGVETYERTDLETNLLSEVGLIADRILEVRSPKYMPRISAVNLDAATGRNVVDVLIAADPHAPARFYCQHHSPDPAPLGRTVLADTMMVVGVEHTITPETWTARIALDNAKPFQVTQASFWSDGTANTARWNSASLPNALHSSWSEAA